ncbi:MAG: hypothetical protein JKY02_06815, partial [Flavobacteriaceae bacterium]|nr:hypothetical protein [Flavobacteriaceae bacterium]
MKPTLQQQKGQEFLVTIYTKAWVDKNFKQELIKNPVKTLNKFTGKKVNFPIDKTLVIEDQTNSNYIYLN